MMTKYVLTYLCITNFSLIFFQKPVLVQEVSKSMSKERCVPGILSKLPDIQKIIVRNNVTVIVICSLLLSSRDLIWISYWDFLYYKYTCNLYIDR